MTLFIVIASLGLLVLLITYWKVNSFIAFLLVSLFAGVCLGLPLPAIAKSIQKGLGDTLGSLVVILVLGAMLGKLVASSGAAKQISGTLIDLFGLKNITWGLMLTGFVIGIPLFVVVLVKTTLFKGAVHETGGFGLVVKLTLGFDTPTTLG